MPSVRVLSFDFDGCLFNKHYKWQSTAARRSLNAVIVQNKSFLDAIKIENTLYREVSAFIGSARQSNWLDKANSRRNDTELCFDAIQKVCHYLDIEFNPLLLTDVYQGLPVGTSYWRATGAESGHNLDFPGDETKLTLLYAQMHAAALEYPNDTIIFDFYDDRDHDTPHARGILSFLSQVFKEYPQLIPSNVLLRLNHYAGDRPSVFGVIKGRGECERYYGSKINAIFTSLGDDETMIRFDNLLPHLHLMMISSQKETKLPVKLLRSMTQSTVTWGIFSPFLIKNRCLRRPDTPPCAPMNAVAF